MDDKNYDEFGHYIGPDIPDISDDDDDDNDNDNNEYANDNNIEVDNNNINTTNTNTNINVNDTLTTNIFNNIQNENYSVVLHEDKNFYPDANEVYPGVDNIVQEEDMQPITEPIIPPAFPKVFDLLEPSLPQTTFNYEFVSHLMTVPALIRNIAVAGALHHGKTSLMDIYIQLTHNNNKLNLFKEPKYLDIREDEQRRKISIKANPISLVLQNTKGKSYLFNFIDTPGHSNFIDEIQSAFRLCDGVLLVVDVVEGVVTQTEKIIKMAIIEGLDIVLVVNKIDRLILELKIPPNDAYFKIKSVIDDFNKTLMQYEYLYNNNTNNKVKYVHPNYNNVIFMSSLYGIVFTLESFAQKYYTLWNNNSNGGLLFNDHKKLSKVLYGDVYYDTHNKKFTKSNNNTTTSTSSSSSSLKRTFVHFILEPLYKVIGYSLSEEKLPLQELLKTINITLKDSEYKMDPKPLLKLICYKSFGNFASLIDATINNVKDSLDGSIHKITSLYNGNRNTPIYNQLSHPTPKGPLAVCVYKMYHKPDHLSFDVFGRVLCGTITKGDNVRILGDKYNLNDKEDQQHHKVNCLWIYQSRYKIEINKVPYGNFVLIDGNDISMYKNFTIVDNVMNSNSISNYIEIFRPIKFDYSYMKVSVEPLNPSDLPKMIEGLRKICKSYPACKTKIEESGENIILGTGELYMDSILYDLRHIYTEIELKVSDPVVTFCETVTETSSLKCTCISHNNKNTLSMIAEPLNKEIVSDINNGIIEHITTHNKNIHTYLQDTHHWDKFTTKSLWSFDTSTNMLIDFTLPSENDAFALNTIKDSIIQGFNWACREGPLCSEPILNTKFKIMSSLISSDPLFKGSGQIIPMTRRVCYSSFLTGCPRLMEPMLTCEIMCPLDCIETVNTILMRRRGHVNEETPLQGTPFYIIKAILPALDSFGFETDIRTTTAGQAYCMMWFDKYNTMPGDPLDRSIKLVPLEPSAAPALARECMIKTRRRKGLIDEVNLVNYLSTDEVELLKDDLEYKNYFI